MERRCLGEISETSTVLKTDDVLVPKVIPKLFVSFTMDQFGKAVITFYLVLDDAVELFIGVTPFLQSSLDLLEPFPFLKDVRIVEVAVESIKLVSQSFAVCSFEYWWLWSYGLSREFHKSL